VISAQPSVDADQIQCNKMKLAMAVGDSRQYGVDGVMPRHFVQTAAKAEIGAATIEVIFEELQRQASTARDKTLRNLPSAQSS
jgi:serine/threonine-protein kinase HipA